jgi:hypothetical protein
MRPARAVLKSRGALGIKTLHPTMSALARHPLDYSPVSIFEEGRIARETRTRQDTSMREEISVRGTSADGRREHGRDRSCLRMML